MSLPAAARILADLRERWLERGVELWAPDPRERPGDGWVRARDLADDDERLRRAVSEYAAAHGIDKRKAAASLLGKRLGSMITFPATVAWMAWKRVPRVDADHLWLRFTDGHPDKVAVPEPAAWVLPDDELAADAAGGDGTVEVLDDDALIDRLVASAYDGGMGPLIAGLHRVERTGQRHLWGNLALTAVNSALWSRDGADPWGDGLRLLARHGELTRTLEPLPAEHPDAGPFTVALRKTCCMAYADPDHGYCASCNLLDRDERIADLTARIGAAWADPAGR